MRPWARILGFLVAVVVVVAGLSWAFTPSWSDWNNADTVHGFYEQPKNSLQVVFVGTSQTVTGVSPDELWRTQGICSYDLGTERQPVLASYLWLQEAYRLHPESLEVVVLDVSSFTAGLSFQEQADFAEKSVANMEYLPSRWHALSEIDKRYYGQSNVLNVVVPVVRYHSRWSRFGEEGTKPAGYEYPGLLSRGQDIRFTNTVSCGNPTMYVPKGSITEQVDSDRGAINQAAQGFTEREALEDMVAFCRDHDLQLVFVKIPRASWSDTSHDMVSELAASMDVDFLDISVPSAMSQIGLVPATDYIDVSHPNAIGAQKITGYLGSYLAQECGVRDVRDEPEYAFMEEYADYHENVLNDMELQQCDNLRDYLDHIDLDRHTVFITVRDDASKGLDQATRDKLEELGLPELAAIGSRDSYVAAANSDNVREVLVHHDKEEREANWLAGIAEETALLEGTFRNGTLEFAEFSGNLAATPDEEAAPMLSALAGDNIKGYFGLTSGGYYSGAASAILIEEESVPPVLEEGILSDVCEGYRGINIAVYDRATGKLIDNSSFDTYEDGQRTSDIVPDSYWAQYEEAVGETQPVS